MKADKNRRILVVDDNRAIHEDFRRILVPPAGVDHLAAIEAELLGTAPAPAGDHYTVDSAYQGPAGVEKARVAAETGAPYAVAFVDMRMPPGWDGVQTIEKIWEVDHDIQIVLCTAFADYSWTEIQRRFGATDRLLLLKKPFDVGEIRQLACALTEKWQMARHAEALRAALTLDISHRAELEKLKNELISTVSHELRTPLTSIRGGLGLLEGGVLGALPPDALEIVHIARVNSDRLIRLVNEMLDLEKMEAGELALKIGPIFVPRLVGAALDGLRPASALVGVELRAAEVAPVTIRGDEDRLVQVLTNLVANAIKFAPRSSVVDIRVDSTSAGRARFSVSDRGKGIAEADRARIFGKFQQVDASDSRGHGGSGLGLAISKAIVEQHGGEIGVSSRLGQGSTFWFELPTGAAQAEEVA